METEKLAVIGLVIIIVAGLSTYLILNENILDIFKEDEDVVDDTDYVYFDRYTTIQRNVTQDITSPTPAKILEEQLFAILRLMDENFNYGLGSYADETIYFEIEIVNVYNTSEDDIEPDESIIELGFCADVHYIIRYASNDTAFSYSYDDVETKTGNSTLKVYVHTDNLVPSPTNFSNYYSSLYAPVLMQDPNYINYLNTPLAIKEGFIDALINMSTGDQKTTDHILPINAFGVSPQIGDIFNLSAIYPDLELSVLEIQENVEAPPNFGLDENTTTTMYILRDGRHYIGEIISSVDNIIYSSWVDSSAVTKINDTHIWIYITPTTSVDESFTWVSIIYDAVNGTQTSTAYPTDASKLSTLDDDTIIVTHNPKIGENISVIIETYFGPMTSTYNVVKVTDEKIATVEDLGEE